MNKQLKSLTYGLMQCNARRTVAFPAAEIHRQLASIKFIIVHGDKCTRVWSIHKVDKVIFS